MIDPYVFKSNSQLTIDKKLLITSRHIGAWKICAIILDGAIKHIDIIKKEHYYESFPTQIKTMNDYPLVTVFVWRADYRFIVSFPKFKMLENDTFLTFPLTSCVNLLYRIPLHKKGSCNRVLPSLSLYCFANGTQYKLWLKEKQRKQSNTECYPQ